MARKRARNSGTGRPRKVADLLPALARDSGWSQLLEIVNLRRMWPELVGAAVAAHTRPERLARGRLTVLVDSSPWLVQLGFLKGDVQAQVNACLGDSRVQEVVLMVGRVGGDAPKPTRRRREALPSPADLAEVESALKDLSDESARESLRTLMLADLRARRRPASS